MRYGLVANERKDSFWQKLPELLDWFKAHQVNIVLSDRVVKRADFEILADDFAIVPQKEIPDCCDMILAVGGDGTILRTVQAVGRKETPILGINVGGLGFLTEIPLEKFTQEFEKIFNGHYNIEKRFILECIIEDQDYPLYALNEILIDKANSVRVIQIQVEIDGQYLNSYISDGLLIATPTGSTGYSLSSGGPIITPASQTIVINPLNPHSLTNRPIIIPANAVIEATVRTEFPVFNIAADGREVYTCPTRTKITIQKADYFAHLVKPIDSNFFSLLHHKLDWGNDFRDKNRWSYDS